jgi:hypothetical protein
MYVDIDVSFKVFAFIGHWNFSVHSYSPVITTHDVKTNLLETIHFSIFFNEHYDDLYNHFRLVFTCLKCYFINICFINFKIIFDDANHIVTI